MGVCTSCCKESSSYEDITPDPEVRRQELVKAAEKRQAEQERRGIGNVETVKRQQQLAKEKEKREAEAQNSRSEAGLKWQVN